MWHFNGNSCMLVLLPMKLNNWPQRKIIEQYYRCNKCYGSKVHSYYAESIELKVQLYLLWSKNKSWCWIFLGDYIISYSVLSVYLNGHSYRQMYLHDKNRYLYLYGRFWCGLLALLQSYKIYHKVSFVQQCKWSHRLVHLYHWSNCWV